MQRLDGAMSVNTPVPGVGELAQSLIRIDTSNPPGAEAAAAKLVAEVLERAGIETTVRASDPSRPNLVARLAGNDQAPPLVVQGHLDVVPARAERWGRDPFAGEVVDGVLWGRGAHDMKGPLAMMVTALCRVASGDMRPPGDVIFVAFSDEESGGGLGAKFMVEDHSELFEGARYAIGEFGAVSLDLMDRRFYPIQVAERQWCRLELAIQGRSGHASVPVRGEAFSRLAAVLARIDSERLPARVPAITAQMVEAIAAKLPAEAAEGFRKLADLAECDEVVAAAGAALEPIDAMLRNTVMPTRIHAAERFDAVPDVIRVELDGRVVPESTPDELIEEVEAVCGDHATVKLLAVDEPPREPDMALFPALARALRDIDPDAIAVPMLLPGSSDGRWLARLGIQHYGFIPMRVPVGFPIVETTHSPNERIPLAALEFGSNVLSRLLTRFDEGEDDVAP